VSKVVSLPGPVAPVPSSQPVSIHKLGHPLCEAKTHVGPSQRYLPSHTMTFERSQQLQPVLLNLRYLDIGLVFVAALLGASGDQTPVRPSSKITGSAQCCRPRPMPSRSMRFHQTSPQIFALRSQTRATHRENKSGKQRVITMATRDKSALRRHPRPSHFKVESLSSPFPSSLSPSLP
jgi:hypothetical protein